MANSPERAAAPAPLSGSAPEGLNESLSARSRIISPSLLLPAEAPRVAAETAALPALDLVGLMTMAPLAETGEMVRPVFAALRECLARVNRTADLPAALTELSMGMTQDYEVAIEEGATIVRVGTALFR